MAKPSLQQKSADSRWNHILWDLLKTNFIPRMAFWLLSIFFCFLPLLLKIFPTMPLSPSHSWQLFKDKLLLAGRYDSFVRDTVLVMMTIMVLSIVDVLETILITRG